jgi:hypothetical protein
MSQREPHPIDDLFRRGLAEAEVVPPPSVWEGVQRGRRRSGWLPWPGLNGLLLLLIPATLATAWLAWPVDGPVEAHVVASMPSFGSAPAMAPPPMEKDHRAPTIHLNEGSEEALPMRSDA